MVKNIFAQIFAITVQKYFIVDSGGNRTWRFNCHGSLVAKNLRKFQKRPVFWHSKIKISANSNLILMNDSSFESWYFGLFIKFSFIVIEKGILVTIFENIGIFWFLKFFRHKFVLSGFGHNQWALNMNVLYNFVFDH